MKGRCSETFDDEFVFFFVCSVADVNVKNNGGRTALHYAARDGWKSLSFILNQMNVCLLSWRNQSCKPEGRRSSPIPNLLKYTTSLFTLSLFFFSCNDANMKMCWLCSWSMRSHKWSKNTSLGRQGWSVEYMLTGQRYTRSIIGRWISVSTY